jgi:hypothetical protein
MNAPPPLDDIASALIDGLLTADEAAAARRDPAVVVRAAQMQAARDLVRQVPPVEAGAGDRALAAALGAFDESQSPTRRADEAAGGTGGRPIDPTRPFAGPPVAAGTAGGVAGAVAGAPSGEPPAAPVLSLPARAAARRQSGARWLGAAAVLAVLVALGGILASQGGTSDETAQDAGEAETSQSADEGDGAGGDDRATAEETTPSPDGPAEAEDGATLGPADETLRDADLGSVGSATELAARAEAVLAGSEEFDVDEGLDAGDEPRGPSNDSGGPAPTTTVPVRTCPDPLASAPGAGPLVLRGRAVLGGQPVEVWVHEAGGTRRMVATDASCIRVADEIVPG